MQIRSILVFNASGSSLKFALFETQLAEPLKIIIRGAVSDIGGISSLSWSDGNTSARIHIKAINHADAADLVLDWLHHLWPFGSLLDGVGVVAHRIMHGGQHFHAPIIVTEKVMMQLEKLTQLAPLHNPQAISVMQTCYKQLPSNALVVAVFDTAFFHDLPQYTSYALAKSLVKQYLLLDKKRNYRANAAHSRISADTSNVSVYVTPVDEESLIAEDARIVADNYKSSAAIFRFPG